MNFGKNLENVLKIRKIKQKDLAQKINLTPSAINNYIKNKTEPNLEMITKIAEELKITTDELLGIKQDPELTEHTRLINKIKELNEIECHKLIVFAEGLITNRPVEQKEKTFTIIKNIENEELNEMFSKLSFGEQNEVLGYIQKKIKLKEEKDEK